MVIKVEVGGWSDIVAVDNLTLEFMQGEVGGPIRDLEATRLPKGFIMLVNDERVMKGLRINPVARHLYRTDLHGTPILGNVLIVREGSEGTGYDILNPEDIEDLKKLWSKLNLEEMEEEED